MPDSPSKLLIIDDQPDSVALLLSYLGDRDLDIRVALDGADGLAKAALDRPDLILLDVTMPGMDGFAVCEQLKSAPATTAIPVLFLTASTAIEDKLRGFALGGADYITKPFSEEEVIARVFVHLNTRLRFERLEALAASQALESISDLTGRDDQLFSRVVAILQKRLAQPPTLADLTQELGVNERRLTELFRQRVGMTVFDYFAELRLETARRILEGSNLRVQVIAHRIGYSNAGDFTRAFRRRYGVSPREFRQARAVEDPDSVDALP